ncbi:MAG: TonB-dependent receptor [Betaproteobacteria bacterium]|nr:MAG: TonB-dependent receptor [Betaproteobacteria bacterium]
MSPWGNCLGALRSPADLSLRQAAPPTLALAVALITILGAGRADADNPAEVFELPTVTVIGTTPLPGLGTPAKDVPANVQVFGARDLARQRPLDLTDFLDRNANSVGTGSGQGNAYQRDLSFRGFVASPLLGTPQGVSVFQDGVRINEAFGDVVNWDLLPRAAISSVQLVPGSNPVFGLNTLGGALAIYTKSGAQYPGGSIELSGGSFGRKTIGFEYGGARDRIDYFMATSFADEHGWADHNPSRVRQFFGKVGYQDERADLDVSLTLADNALQGTQTLPAGWLDTPTQAYTFPDLNENRLAFVAAKGSLFLSEGVLLGGNAYFRHFRNRNLSSNVNDDFGTIDPETGIQQINQATNDRSTINQKSWGLGLQVTAVKELAGHRNQFVAGISGDIGDTTFTQQSQEANFTVDRGAVGNGEFLPTTDVGTRNRYLGVFAADTLALSTAWTLTLSGRFNHARIEVADRSGTEPGLDSISDFSRFNPAVGINFNPSATLTTYASYSEGMRAPSPIELTCADAAAPCKLPNVFLSDPPLRQVVSRTIEAGARGGAGSGTTWSAAVYRTDLDDDIQFIASGQGAINAGYFQNVGKTRREGIELGATTRLSDLTLNVRYSHTDATFRSTFVAASPNNSTADAAGAIVVHPGNRIPGIPADSLKLRADLDLAAGWSVGGSVVFASSQYAHGDENNRDVHGRVPGYAVIDVDARWRVAHDWEIFASIVNVLDRRYQNFAVLGANAFTGPDRSFGPALGLDPAPEQFRAVGAPRGIWIGVRYAFGFRQAGD